MRVEEPYSRGESLPFPALTATLSSPGGQEGLRLVLKVDTGFHGGVLVSPKEYSELGLQRFEEPEGKYSGRTVTGLRMPLRASRGSLRVGRAAFRCSVFTAPLVSSPLIGLELLNRWRTLLDGKAEKLAVEP